MFQVESFHHGAWHLQYEVFDTWADADAWIAATFHHGGARIVPPSGAFRVGLLALLRDCRRTIEYSKPLNRSHHSKQARRNHGCLVRIARERFAFRRALLRKLAPVNLP